MPMFRFNFKTLLYLYLTLISSVLLSTSHAEATKSYAEEYKPLRLLLEQVTNRETALKLKPKIEDQVIYLNSTQSSGSQLFESLSASEKKLFIKRFQNNRFHCSEVTSVMNERRRILLNPDLSFVLRDTLNQIP